MKRSLSLLLAAGGFAASLGAGASRHDAGEVSFPNSGSTAAQAPFLRGLALLHDFEYERAAAEFRNAEKLDPSFAMAYWGEAMTHNHPIWMQQDRDAAREALGRLGASPEARSAKAGTGREKEFLNAVEVLYGGGSKEERDLRYCDAMRRVAERFPDDPEAETFYALSILGTAHNGRDIPTYMRAAAILERVRCRLPNHPGAAHYLIHSYDDPVHAVLGLDAARAYSKIAPDAAHAQHMTSHIFLALGMWDDVVSANETAVAVVNRQRAAENKGAVSCGHYPFWLEYGYLQQGRLREARRVLEACRMQAKSMASMKADSETLDPDDHDTASFEEMRTRYVLDSEDWAGDEVADGIDTGRALLPRFADVFTRGYAGAKRGDLESAARGLVELTEIGGRLGPLFDRAGYRVEQWSRKLPGIEIAELQGLIAQASGHSEEAISLLRSATASEEALPSAFGPPAVDKPSSELLGEVLLAARRPAEAKAAFEASLRRAPRRTASLLGLLRSELALRDEAGAADARKQLKEIWHAADSLPAEVR